MSKRRRQYSADFEFRVALEAARGTKTISELSRETGVHPNQISQWKKQLLEEGASVLKTNNARQQREQEKLEAELYEQIGRLGMELEWLKTKLTNDILAKRAMIEPGAKPGQAVPFYAVDLEAAIRKADTRDADCHAALGPGILPGASAKERSFRCPVYKMDPVPLCSDLCRSRAMCLSLR